MSGAPGFMHMPSPTNGDGGANDLSHETSKKVEFGCTGRRRVLQTSAVALAGTSGCIAGEFPSGGMAGGGGPGGGNFGNGSSPENPTNAKEDLQWWAAQQDGGENGRPFPVTGSWNIGNSYNQHWDSELSDGWSAGCSSWSASLGPVIFRASDR
jgi:hypothetical protein